MKEIDWEERRYEIAKDVMANYACRTHYEILKLGVKPQDDKTMEQSCAHCAVSFADALIEELKQTTKE